MTQKRDIRAFTKSQLQEYFLSVDEPKFRATQVYEWLWQKGAKSI